MMKSTLKGLFLFFMAMMAAMPASAQVEVWNIGKLQTMVEKVEDNAAGKVFVSPVELTSEEQIAAVDGFYQTAPYMLYAPAYSQETRMTWYYYAKPNPGYKFLGFVTTKTGTPTVDIATLKKVGDFYQTSGRTSATGARPETNPVPLARYAVFEKEASGGGEGGEAGPVENIKATGALYPKTIVVGEGSDATGVVSYLNLVDAKLTANGGETVGAGDQVTHIFITFDAELADIPAASAASRILSQQLSLINKSSGKKISFNQYSCGIWSKDKKALDLMISSEDWINNEDYQGVYEFKLPAGVVKSAKGAVNDAYEFTFTYGDPNKAKIEEPINLADFIGIWDQAKEQGEKIDNPCSFYLEKIGEEYYLTHLYGDTGIKVRIIDNGNNKFALAATSADGYSFGTTRGGDVDVAFMDNNGTKGIFVEQFQYLAPGKAAIIGGECGFQRTSTEVPTTPEVVLNILPILTPASGTYEDKVVVTCTFPEGCAGGKYWIDGAEIAAKLYTGPIVLERSARLSVAGINAQGKIITDVVTNEYIVNKVTEPYVTTDPAIGSSRESFYVTKLQWNNAASSDVDLTDFKDGGSRRGQNVVWLVYEPTQKIVSTQDYQGLWKDGTNGFKAYLYKNYRPTDEGAYTLHIASNVFVVNGEKYNKELVLKYFVGADEQTAPEFSPASGTYKDKVEVTITYPKNAFYQFYQIEGKDRQNYTGPITITENCTIKAWGRTEDFSEETETATATYTIVPSEDKMQVYPTPRISRSGNTVTIVETEPNTIIKYWFDNQMNTAQLYTAPFTVDKNCLISAVAYNDKGISPTSNYTISHFPKEETDLGTIELRTPEDWESVNLTGMSPNGRFVCGYTNAGGTPMTFIWDLTSGKSEYISTQYYSYPTAISNDGTVCGWRTDSDPVTGENISTSDETLFYGYYQNGEWTRQPSGMTVKGITGDNVLYGSFNGRPATYNIATKSLMTYHGGKGSLDCVSDDGNTFGGQVVVSGKTTAAYWVGNTDPVTIATDRECAVKSISGNGQWMLLDNPSAWGVYTDIAGYRYDAATGNLETLTSMGAQYPSRYEWMYSIANDGTLYGVYDRSLLSHDAGSGLVYGKDGVWRNVTEILADKGYTPNNAIILSSKLVSADQNLFVMTAFPADMEITEAFNFGLAVKFDAQVKHSAPTTVKAVQMVGVKTVKVTWEAPMNGAQDVASYKLFRDGAAIATVGADTFEYFDAEVANHTEYSYAVSAVYKDGVESSLSYPYTIMVALDAHKPARLLTLRQSGINDVNLSWQAPVFSMPKLQYFKEESESAAFGTGTFSAEWAVRITAADINVYKGMQIRTFQFLPTGPQAGYEIRLYKGQGTDDYDTTPFYTQPIDIASINFGTLNTIELNTPQALPENEDLLIALYIKSKGNDNMLGVSHEGFRAGYSDLCKIEGVHDKFISIAKESHQPTEIVIPLGVGLGTDESLGSSMVDKYEVSDNGVVLGNTENINYRTEDVAEGEHTFAVRALYKDGEYSEPVSVTANIKKNEAAFVPVTDLAVETSADGKAAITWKAPLNDDKTNIHWGDMTPSPGLENKNYPVYEVAAIYPVTMTNAYADQYEITHLFYYPTADANFRLFFDDNNIEFTYFDDYVIPEVGKLNIVPLETPVTIDQSTNYRIVITVEDCPNGVAPLAFDSSNKCQDGYSNMINAGNEWMTLFDVVQIDKNPNWLMGMIIRQKDAKEMPLVGYNVLVDGKLQNDKPLEECNFTTDVLAEGSHKATVDVVYDATRTVASDAVNFVIGATGIDGVAADKANAAKYDLQGRRVITDKNGRGLFIMNNKKYIK